LGRTHKYWGTAKVRCNYVMVVTFYKLVFSQNMIGDAPNLRGPPAGRRRDRSPPSKLLAVEDVPFGRAKKCIERQGEKRSGNFHRLQVVAGP